MFAFVILGFGGLLIPSFSHGPRFESRVIGEMRDLVSAQSAYSWSNEGLYGALECLPAPAGCLRGHSGPAFLDARMLAPVRHRYRHSFHPGPPGQGTNGARGFSSYAYVAVPLKPGRAYTVRSFCVDDSGAIRYDGEGGVPQVSEGRCPASMTLLN